MAMNDTEKIMLCMQWANKYHRLDPKNVGADLGAIVAHDHNIKHQIDMYIKSYQQLLEDLEKLRYKL